MVSSSYLGKWHLIEDKNSLSLEILEGGNLIAIEGNGDSSIGKWYTSEGGIIVVLTDSSISQAVFGAVCQIFIMCV